MSSCPEDHFYDSVVEQCCSCADICTKSALTFCQNNCADYYRKTFHATTNAMSSSRTSHPDDVVPLVYVERLIDKPLFWTSVTSMTVALVATIGIIVLCVMRWRAAGRSGRRSRSRRPRPGTRRLGNHGDAKSFDVDEEKSIESESDFRSTVNSREKFLSDDCKQPENGCHYSVANRLQASTPMGTLVSEDDGGGPVSRGLGSDVSARAPHLSIKTFPFGGKQLPRHVNSIEKPHGQPVDDDDASYTQSERPWTTHYSSFYETSVKRLSLDQSIDDVSSNGGLVYSNDDLHVLDLLTSTALPVIHVTGIRPRPSALNVKEDIISLRSETGYRSELSLT